MLTVRDTKKTKTHSYLNNLECLVIELHIRSRRLLHNVVLQYYNRGKCGILQKHIGKALDQA